MIRYPGGKRTLAPWIVSHLPAHRRYVEGFAGAASVLLAKPRSFTEVIIERNPSMVLYHRIVRDEVEALIDTLRFVELRYGVWREAKDRLEAGDWHDCLDRARLVYITRRMSYNGGGKTFSSARGQSWWDRGVSNLRRVSRRIQGVRIVSGDILVHLSDLDSHHTCWYFDPPYQGVRNLYGPYGLSDEHHEDLCRRIRRLRGKVVLSGYVNPVYSRLLSDWRIVTRQVSIHVHGVGRVGRMESLWIKP